MSEETTHKSADKNTKGDLYKELNEKTHFENENIKKYLSEIEDLKTNSQKTEAENEQYKSKIIKNAKEFKQSFINFIHNYKECFQKGLSESEYNNYFDSDNFPINNFFDKFNEQYFSILINQAEDKKSELAKQQKESDDSQAKIKNLSDDLKAIKNEHEASNKKFTLIKEKYEESLKGKNILEKEKSDLKKANENLEHKISELNKNNQALHKEIEGGLINIKALEEQLQLKHQKQNDEELENLRGLVDESNKKFDLEKATNAELEEKIITNESVINSLKDKLNAHDDEAKELKDQLEDSKKLIYKENIEVENLIRIKEQLEQEAYKNLGLIGDLKNKITSLESQLKANEAINETKDKDKLECLITEKNNLESQLNKLSAENINLIRDVDELKNKIVKLNQDNEIYNLENSKLLSKIQEFTIRIQSLDEFTFESKELKNQIKDLTETIELNKQLTNKLESTLIEKNNLIEEMKKQNSVKDSSIKATKSEEIGRTETENDTLKQEIDLLKEENVNLNLTIQEKNEIIINLEYKAKEIETECNLKIDMTEEETNKKLLEMDLQIQDLNDKLVQKAKNSREDEKVKILNSKYVDLKEKCSDFVGILESELRDFGFYVDKRLVINFLFKYFDKNSNEKLKYSLLETLANILSLDSDDRRKLNLTPLINTQYASNNNNNVMTDIESIPFIISKFNEYLENIHFE